MHILDVIANIMMPAGPWMALACFVVGVLVGMLVGMRMRAGGAPVRAAQRSGRVERQERTERVERGERARPGNDSAEIYVGNLPYTIGDKELLTEFSVFGEVTSARVIKNNFTGKSKGYGFVIMPRRAEAEAAIKALHASDMKGREIVVNIAKTRSRQDDE